MASEERTMEFVGRMAMKWLEDCAENPKHGSYMEAVADLTTRILGGAIEAAGYLTDEDTEIIGGPDERGEQAQVG